MAQQGSPHGGAREGEFAPRPRALLFVRGAVAGVLLGASSVAAAIGATLALFPAALRPVPRGRVDESPGVAEPAAARREPLAG